MAIQNEKLPENITCKNCLNANLIHCGFFTCNVYNSNDVYMECKRDKFINFSGLVSKKYFIKHIKQLNILRLNKPLITEYLGFEV